MKVLSLQFGGNYHKMIEKDQTTKLETNDVIVKITEYPFYPGEEFHLNIEPQEKLEYIEIHGNPRHDQTLVLRIGDFMMWIKDEHLAELVEKAIKKYRKGWRD